jgi:enoyl-CoA hydratase/carnithine racemase
VFSTPEALAWGLIHATTPAFELEDRVIAIATALANADQAVVQAILSPASYL